MAKRKLTRAEREELLAHHERVLDNARRTRELAERAMTKLDPHWKAPTRYDRSTIFENARRTRELAERAQAKLDAQRAAES
jgi:hypothetical protein